MLPPAAPVARRAQRTGLVAVSTDQKDGAIDASTQRKKAFANVATAGFIKRFTPGGVALGWRDWPTDFDPTEAADDDRPKVDGNQHGKGGGFPFLDGSRTVAFIKGDGNGMGQALIKLKEVETDGAAYIKLFDRFSRAVHDSTVEAARTATREVLLPAREKGQGLAARPLILGGDDLLIVVRADLALAYVHSFASAFERVSREQLGGLNIAGLPQGMSMGFGVAYVSADQPFALAAQMAEVLMERAKDHAKERSKSARTDDGHSIAPSTVQFHRITASLWADSEAQIEAETQIEMAGSTYVHTLGCYALSAVQARAFQLPALDDLFALQDVLAEEKIAHGAMRGLLNALETDATQAREDYKRWREQMARRGAQALADFDAALQRLLSQGDVKAFPYTAPQGSKPAMSPLGDALTLRAVGNRTNKEASA